MIDMRVTPLFGFHSRRCSLAQYPCTFTDICSETENKSTLWSFTHIR